MENNELKACTDVILRMEHKIIFLGKKRILSDIEIESLQYDINILKAWAGINKDTDTKEVVLEHIVKVGESVTAVGCNFDFGCSDKKDGKCYRNNKCPYRY